VPAVATPETTGCADCGSDDRRAQHRTQRNARRCATTATRRSGGGTGDQGVRRGRQRGGGGGQTLEAQGVGGDGKGGGDGRPLREAPTATGRRESSGLTGYSWGCTWTWAGPLPRAERMVSEVGEPTPSTCCAEAGRLTAGTDRHHAQPLKRWRGPAFHWGNTVG